MVAADTDTQTDSPTDSASDTALQSNIVAAQCFICLNFDNEPKLPALYSVRGASKLFHFTFDSSGPLFDNNTRGFWQRAKADYEMTGVSGGFFTPFGAGRTTGGSASPK